MTEDKQGRSCEAEVRRFFEEHPVHQFGSGTIAGYLGLDLLEVQAVLCKLAHIGYLKETYHLSPAALHELREKFAEGGVGP